MTAAGAHGRSPGTRQFSEAPLPCPVVKPAADEAGTGTGTARPRASQRWRRAGLGAARYAATLLLVVGAVLFGLTHENVANAQTDTIWSATLTVGTKVGEGPGYEQNSHGSLSPTQFTFRGTQFTVPHLQLPQGGSLFFGILPNASARSIFRGRDIRLQVGTTELLIGDADRVGASFVWTNTGLSWSDGETVAVKLVLYNSPATGKPTITGTARVHEYLMAETGTIADANGTDNATLAYQWVRVDGANETDIPGATSLTYRLANADEGKRVRVKVSFTDDDGYSESPTSDAFPSSGTIAARFAGPNSPAEGRLLVSGTPKVGQVLTMNTAGISDANGLPERIYYGWMRLTHHTRLYSRTVDIDMFTGKTYTLTQADVGSKIIATMWYRDLDGHHEVVDSEPYPGGGYNRAVGPASNSPATGKPVIAGVGQNSAHVNKAVEAKLDEIRDADGMPDHRVFPNDITYQWLLVDGGTTTDMANETNRIFMPTSDHVGKMVRVRVSFTDKAGNSESVTSDTFPERRPTSPRQRFRNVRVHDGDGFISNPIGGHAVINIGGTPPKLAQRFRTGSNPDGYELERVWVGIPVAWTATPSLSLHLGGADGTRIMTLSGTAGATGMREFTPASGTSQSAKTLAPNTDYSVVLGTSASSGKEMVGYIGYPPARASGAHRFDTPYPVNETRDGVRVTAPLGVAPDAWGEVVARLAGRSLIPEHARLPMGMLAPLERGDAVLRVFRCEAVVWTTATPVVLPGRDHRRGRPRPHPLAPLRGALASRGLPDARTVATVPGGRRVRYAGIVICRQRPATASGVTFMTLEDETGLVNVVVWKRVFDACAVLARTVSFLGVTGTLQSEHGVVHIVAEALWAPKLPARPPATRSRSFR